MKKTYMQPKMEVFKMHVHQMLCGSIQQEGNNLKVSFGDDTFGESETIN